MQVGPGNQSVDRGLIVINNEVGDAFSQHLVQFVDGDPSGAAVKGGGLLGRRLQLEQVPAHVKVNV